MSESSVFTESSAIRLELLSKDKNYNLSNTKELTELVSGCFYIFKDLLLDMILPKLMRHTGDKISWYSRKSEEILLFALRRLIIT